MAAGPLQEVIPLILNGPYGKGIGVEVGVGMGVAVTVGVGVRMGIIVFGQSMGLTVILMTLEK
jgi:hypothetical protein